MRSPSPSLQAAHRRTGRSDDHRSQQIDGDHQPFAIEPVRVSSDDEAEQQVGDELGGGRQRQVQGRARQVVDEERQCKQRDGAAEVRDGLTDPELEKSLPGQPEAGIVFRTDEPCLSDAAVAAVVRPTRSLGMSRACRPVMLRS
jgi:hypothetical protein